MKAIVLDVENTTYKLSDKYSDYTPYNPNNKLVSIGHMNMVDYKLAPVKYAFVHHNEIDGPDIVGIAKFREELAQADCIIAHNAKYDIQWLEETGFDCSNKRVIDTMVAEYIMCRGRGDISLRLADTCKRYEVAEKGEIFDKYPDLNIAQMPLAEVLDYGMADIQACAELYLAQRERLRRPDYAPLHKTIDMMHEFLRVLTSMERRGVKIDQEALALVEAQFIAESEQLKFDINATIKQYMGDTVVNLESPKQLSEVIYSRRVKPGQEENWVRTFNIGKDARNKPLKRPKMNFKEYADHVRAMSQPVLKTEVKRCEICDGQGTTQKLRKDGSFFKNRTKCKDCKGSGAIYHEINEIAGFQMQPKNIYFTTVNGFSTSSTFLDELIEQAIERKKPDAKTFLEKIQRLSSVSSYLSNFVGGIKTFTQSNGILHTNFNQCITATGRLSSTKPNLQNMPREATFPIRKVFTSRFDGGSVSEVDFAQLEFRAAVHLAGDVRGREDILNGIDIHSQTARTITEAGQPIGRQDAKSRTFKPLYGGVTGTDAEREYYKKFLKEYYTGIGEWHKCLQEEALATRMITLPTGRQYIFPDVERAWHGGATKYTQIVNFPVQGFATADIVPLALIRLEREFTNRNLRSLLVLTVHDSILVDTHPDETGIVVELLSKLGQYAEEELVSRYGITMFVPLAVDVKTGLNAMEMKKIA